MSRRARKTSTGSSTSDAGTATDDRRASIARGLQGRSASWRDLADSWRSEDETRRGSRTKTTAAN